MPAWPTSCGGATCAPVDSLFDGIAKAIIILGCGTGTLLSMFLLYVKIAKKWHLDGDNLFGCALLIVGALAITPLLLRVEIWLIWSIFGWPNFPHR